MHVSCNKINKKLTRQEYILFHLRFLKQQQTETQIEELDSKVFAGTQEVPILDSCDEVQIKIQHLDTARKLKLLIHFPCFNF